MSDEVATHEVLESFVSKLNALELSVAEGDMLESILTRSEAASEGEVQGFGWDEGVRAIQGNRDPVAPRFRIDVPRVAGSLGLAPGAWRGD